MTSTSSTTSTSPLLRINRKILREGRSAVFVVVSSLLLACSPLARALPTWDLGSDFSTTNGNPNNLSAPRGGSSWSYGHMAPTSFVPDPTQFTPFPHTNGDFDTSTGLESWNIDGGDPNVRHNPSGDPINCCGGAITWQPNGVTFSPWGSSATGTRWTAPAAGTYVVTATFTDVQGISEPVYIYRASTLLFHAETGEPTGASVTYSDTIAVQAAGETLDFVATGPYNVGVQITISNAINGLAWDLGSDFSTSNGNPNNLSGARAGSSWIYGTYASIVVSAAALELFPHPNGAFDTSSGLESWNLDGGDPNVRHNPTGSPISSGDVTWLPNSVTFSESGSLGLVGATWTAPSKGVYIVTAKFTDVRGNSEPVYIRHNTAQLFQGETGSSIGSSVSYSNSITIAAQGETLFFLVGGGTNDVEAQVTVTQTSSELPHELLVWNLGDDFSTVGGNPNHLFGLRAGSSWAYGTYGALLYENVTGFTAFTNVNGGFDESLGTESWHFADGDPNVRHNPTTSPATCCGGLITWPPNAVSFSPSGSGGTSGGAGAQWVAPGAGTYQVVATFTTVQGDAPVPVFVAQGTTLLFQGQTGATNGSSVTYSNVLTISAVGEALNFFAQKANNVLAQITITNIANGLGWGLASDFSVVNGNPNVLTGDRAGSSWAYGTFTVVARPDTSTFDVFREVNGAFDASLGLESWNFGGGDPNVRHNPTSTEVSCCDGAVTWLPNGVNFSPAGSPQSVVGARWTAPSAGIYEVVGTFSDRQNVSRPAFVLHGNSLLYSDWTGTPMDSSVTYSNRIWIVGAGETLDFASSGNQNTGAQITITRMTLSPLTISLQGGQVIIEWFGVGTLQRKSELSGLWEDVIGAESPFIITAPTAEQYYRLKL